LNTGFQLVAYSISLGTGLGVSGLHTFDSNQNGLNEIIFGSGSGFGENNQFLIAEYNQASEKLELLCQSERYDAYINNISPFANDSIATGSLIADGDGSIDIIDHETGSKVQSIQTGLSKIQDVNLGDLDNDGSLEIAILSPDTIAIYDANTYAFEQFLNYGGSEFALGHFTSTTKVQIAINSGYVFVLDNQRLSAVWDYSLIGFSDRHLEAGDIDNDGFDEIVAADRWYNVRVFNADIKGILWEHNPDADIDAVAVYDVTGDSIPEVIYGDGQWGNVYAFNGDNGQQLWSVGNPESGITDVLVGQLDDDDSLELLWGSGYDSTGPDYLFIHDLDTNTRQWKSPEGSEGGINSVSFGRLNADTIPDYIVASSESQDGDGILSAYNGVTNELLWQTTKSTFGGSAWTGIHDVTIGDINGDRINEVLVATSQYYGGVIYVLDASKGDISNTVALEDSSPIYSVRITNIDDDDDMEILAGGSLDNGELNGVYVIDGPTLSWEKNFPNLGRLRTALRVMGVVDIDLDNTQEIIGLLDAAYLIDPDNNGLSRTVSEDLSSLAVSSDTISGDPVVYVGGSEGVLSRLEADASLTPINSSLCEGNIVALEAISPEQLAFVCNGTLGVYAITEGTVTWITKKGFDEILGYYDRLQTEVVNGKKRILVGGSNAYLFEKHEVNQADNSLKIQVRALLQGAYDTGLRLMHRRLAENGFLPLEQPYADLFGHSGDESLEPLIMRFS